MCGFCGFSQDDIRVVQRFLDKGLFGGWRMEKSGLNSLFPFLAVFALMFTCMIAHAETPQDIETFFKNGRDLHEQQKYDEAIAVFEDIDKRFAGSKDAKTRERVATALGFKGVALASKGYRGKALEIWEEADRRYSKDRDHAMRVTLSRLLYNRLQTLVGLSIRGPMQNQKAEFDAAMAVFDEINKRYGKDTDPLIRENIAWAFIQKAMALGHTFNDHKTPSDYSTYRTREAVAVLDEMIQRYGDDEAPVVRLPVAKAIFEKGGIFFQSGKKEEEAAAYDELDRRFGRDEDPDILAMVIEGLYGKAWRLVQTAGGPHVKNINDFAPAFKIMDETVKRFGENKNEQVQEKVIKILLSKASALAFLEDKAAAQDTIAVYDSIDKYYGQAEAPAIRSKVAEALHHKGVALAEKQSKAALAVFDSIDQRYASDKTPEVLEWVARSHIEKGKIYAGLLQREKARESYNLVIQRYKGMQGMSGPVSLAEFYLHGE